MLFVCPSALQTAILAHFLGHGGVLALGWLTRMAKEISFRDLTGLRPLQRGLLEHLIIGRVLRNV